MKLLSVSDLHANPYLLGGLSRAIQKHSPDVIAIVGDTISVFEPPKGTLSPIRCARALAEITDGREVVFARGNHDQYDDWREFRDAWPRPMRLLEGEGCEIDGVGFAGFPCSFVADSLPLVEWRTWLPKLSVAEQRGVWLMHEPPTSDIANWFCVCELWQEPIMRYSPVLVVSGHDHSTPLERGIWKAKMGDTMVACAGQGNARLRYLVADLEPHPGYAPTLRSLERFEY